MRAGWLIRLHLEQSQRRKNSITGSETVGGLLGSWPALYAPDSLASVTSSGALPRHNSLTHYRGSSESPRSLPRVNAPMFQCLVGEIIVAGIEGQDVMSPTVNVMDQPTVAAGHHL
jgi:hypothetical protein